METAVDIDRDRGYGLSWISRFLEANQNFDSSLTTESDLPHNVRRINFVNTEDESDKKISSHNKRGSVRVVEQVDTTESDHNMSDGTHPSREEIDAKLEASAARVETSLVRMESSVNASIMELSSKTEGSIGELRIQVERAVTTSEQSRDAAVKAQDVSRVTRWSLIAVFISACALILITIEHWSQSIQLMVEAVRFQIKLHSDIWP